MNDVKMRLWAFKLKKSFTDIEAINALELYARAGEPIPDNLICFLTQACDAWKKQPGKKIGSKNTELKWSSLVWDVRLQYRLGSTRKEAIKTVANNNNVGLETLESKYKGTKYKSAKDDADMIYESADIAGEITFFTKDNSYIYKGWPK